jgi:hypothetical protein
MGEVIRVAAPRVVDRERLEGILERNLSAKEIALVKTEWGSSLSSVLFGGYCGHYRLDLSQKNDRVTCLLLAERDGMERRHVQALSGWETRIGGTAQRADWSNFRNILFNGNQIPKPDWKTFFSNGLCEFRRGGGAAQQARPSGSVLEFDYVSVERPPAGAAALREHEWQRILLLCGVAPAADDGGASPERLIAHATGWLGNGLRYGPAHGPVAAKSEWKWNLAKECYEPHPDYLQRVGNRRPGAEDEPIRAEDGAASAPLADADGIGVPAAGAAAVPEGGKPEDEVGVVVGTGVVAGWGGSGARILERGVKRFGRDDECGYFSEHHIRLGQSLAAWLMWKSGGGTSAPDGDRPAGRGGGNEDPEAGDGTAPEAPAAVESSPWNIPSKVIGALEASVRARDCEVVMDKESGRPRPAGRSPSGALVPPPLFHINQAARLCPSLM